MVNFRTENQLERRDIVCVLNLRMLHIEIYLVRTWLMAPSVFIADAFGCRLRNTVTESQSDIFIPQNPKNPNF